MLLVRHPNTYAQERSYALEVVLGEFLGIEWRSRSEDRSDVEITVAGHDDSGSLTVADGLFALPGDSWLRPHSLPARPLDRCSLSDIPLQPLSTAPELPVLYGARLPNGSFYAEQGAESRLGIDVLGGVFFQITRYEEIVTADRDEHGRFPADSTLAHREGYLDRPLADEYVELLWSAIQRRWPAMKRRRTTCTQHLSHDVDSPFHVYSPRSTVRLAAADLVRRRNPHLAGARMSTLMPGARTDHTRDPYNTFDFIMDLSERASLRSAFYFITGRTRPDMDGTYECDDPWIVSLMRHIHDRGHELGLHPSYDSYDDPEAIASQHDSLRRLCDRAGIAQDRFGGRQHFLRWMNPTTWHAWDAAGLAYDSTLGFPKNVGFRAGVCREYPVFDLVSRKRLGLRERPLVVMEQALFAEDFSPLAGALDVVRRLRATCKLFGGAFTLLWHNSHLLTSAQRRLYTAIVTDTPA